MDEEEISPTSNYFVCIINQKSKSVVLKWTFKDYSKLILDKEYKIISFCPLPQCDWEICFRKSSDALYLHVENKLKTKIKSSATISVFDYDGKDVGPVLQRSDIFEEDKLNIDSDTYGTLKNQAKDTITFCIEFKIENFDSLEKFEETDYINWKSKSFTKFSEDLKVFILENHPNEVILKTNDAQIKANQAILRARSPVFGKMFVHLMSEKKNEIIKVDDISSDALKTLIDFLHCGEAPLKNDIPHLKELYYAADKYEVLDLRNMCAKTMLFLLSEENVSGVLELAHQHSDQSFEKSCVSFIQRRGILAVMEADSWKKLKVSFPSLAVLVLEFCLKNQQNSTRREEESPKTSHPTVCLRREGTSGIHNRVVQQIAFQRAVLTSRARFNPNSSAS